ncbi:hypothetical protein [Streptomyces sp. NPDC050287]|uniref:hypothetical protein n=1 Tax=Streptomyces sp. NPDC050287 TaxID=3365608 RepID=UPI0037BD2971
MPPSATGLAGFGHRALSAGDVTWSDSLPAACDTLVGISHSGTSGATVGALRMARTAGLRTVAVTSQAGSPLADSADEVQLVPTLRVEELVPCAGHVMLAQGVAAVCGVDTSPFNRALAQSLDRVRATVDVQLGVLPGTAPAAVSVLSLPEVRSGADFWVLKLIEACELAARNVPLEESGHVDYFIGPEPHLTLQLMGAPTAGRGSTVWPTPCEPPARPSGRSTPAVRGVVGGPTGRRTPAGHDTDGVDREQGAFPLHRLNAVRRPPSAVRVSRIVRASPAGANAPCAPGVYNWALRRYLARRWGGSAPT